MEVRHLRALLAVIEEGAVARAAKRLNISQPALTKSIHRLEEHLGVPLFERGPKGMQPTFYAESLRRHARSACISIAEAETEIAALRNGVEGLATIGGHSFILTEFMTEIVARVLDDRPKLQIRMTAQNQELFSELLLGKFDLVVAMLYDELPKDRVVTHHLFDDYLVLAMGKTHPLANRRDLKLSDLADQKWVLGDRETFARQRVKLYFEQRGASLPKPSVETWDPPVSKTFMLTSSHIGIVPYLAVAKDVERGHLVAYAIDSPLMRRPMGLIHRANESLSPAVRYLIGRAVELSEPKRRPNLTTRRKLV